MGYFTRATEIAIWTDDYLMVQIQMLKVEGTIPP